MNNIIEQIDNIQSSIFKYDCNGISNNYNKLLDILGNKSQSVLSDQIGVFNEILRLINIAMENRDFLLLADILEYELKPFVLTNNLAGGTQ